MKFCTRIFAFFCLLISTTIAAPTSEPSEFEKCKSTYDVILAHIIASTGSRATSTIWRFLFNYLDLDGDEEVNAPEIALYLEKDGFVHESDIMEVMHLASDWIAVGDDGNGQMTRDEFVTIIQQTVGENTSTDTTNTEISNYMCQLFTKKVPHVVETMTELSSCTTSLEKALLEDTDERAEFNSWTAIFRTLDFNQDRIIDFEEIKHHVKQHLDENDDVALAVAISRGIHGTIHHDVQDISEKDFYVFVHELLYGGKGIKRTDVWDDVISEEELHGRAIMCNAIFDVRSTLTAQRKVLQDCISSYKETTKKSLGEDAIFAPEIIFTIADANKDASISEHEFNLFIQSTSTLYRTVQMKQNTIDIKIDNFRLLMPDRMIVARGKYDDVQVLETSAMTSHDLDDAKYLCSAIATTIQKYVNGEVIDVSHDVSTEVNQPEPNMGFPMSMSFKGFGEHILVEHTLPPEEEPTATTATTTLEPNEETSTTEESSSILYHVVGANGTPYDLNLNRVEIDDIIHRISIDQHPPPEEPGVSPSAPSEPVTESATEASQEQELIKEIENLLREEEPEVLNPSQEVTSQSSEEENELNDLLRAMQAAKAKKGREN